MPKKHNLRIARSDSNENTLLLGYPSNGLVGTFSTSYLIYYLKLKQLGEIDIPNLISPLFVENGEILGPIRSYKKDNLFVIISDVPFDDYLADDFGKVVGAFCKKYSIKKIVIASGMETINPKKKDKKIFGLVTHQKLDNILYQHNLSKFLNGSIFGTDSAIISVFRKLNIPTLVLYAECHPFFPDPGASIQAIVTVAKILDLKVDTSDIKNRMEQLRIQHRNLMEETIRAAQRQKEKQKRTPQIYR